MKQNKTVIIFITFIIFTICSLFVLNYIINKNNQEVEEGVVLPEAEENECLTGVYVEEYEMCGKEIGRSVEDRPIHVFKIGEGPIKLLFVGGLHTGREQNTVDLAEAMLAYYASSTKFIPEEVSLYFVPALNVDGVANDTHTNANNINLNRNWGTDNWKADVYHPASGIVEGGGGIAPYSEPETLALYNYIQSLQPNLVVVWHSKAGTVEDSDVKAADELGGLYATAAGYKQIDEWTAYEVTGDFVTDMGEEGFVAMEVELETREIEFERNLKGIEAMFDYFKNDQ